MMQQLATYQVLQLSHALSGVTEFLETESSVTSTVAKSHSILGGVETCPSPSVAVNKTLTLHFRPNNRRVVACVNKSYKHY